MRGTRLYRWIGSRAFTWWEYRETTQRILGTFNTKMKHYAPYETANAL